MYFIKPQLKMFFLNLFLKNRNNKSYHDIKHALSDQTRFVGPRYNISRNIFYWLEKDVWLTQTYFKGIKKNTAWDIDPTKQKIGII